MNDGIEFPLDYLFNLVLNKHTVILSKILELNKRSLKCVFSLFIINLLSDQIVFKNNINY
jgi:hypothetical protein